MPSPTHPRSKRLPRLKGLAQTALAMMLPSRQTFSTRALPSGFAFAVSPRDVVGRHIAKYGSHEPALTAWIDRHLDRSPRGVVVDVGANLGWHTVHAAKKPAVDTVIAFEPDAFNAWLLDLNIDANDLDNVIVEACAVGARHGLARLHRYKNSNRGRHSLVPNDGPARRVPMVDLDGALAALGLAHQRILLIKIDVEGFEPAVLDGASATLQITDVVITEYSPALSRAGGLSPQSMLETMTAAGFIPHRLAGADLQALDRAVLDRVDGQLDIIWRRPS